MSIQVAVLLAEDRLLDRDSWQEAIDRLHLPVQLPDPFDPRTDHGYQHFTYRGEPAGCEVDITTTDNAEDWREIRDTLGRRRARMLRGRDCCIVLSWSTQTEAAPCAMAACAALAAVADGVVWDLEADEVLDPVGALAAARHTVEWVDRETARTHPLRARDVRALLAEHVAPVLELETGHPVDLRGGGLIVLGPVGWLARTVWVAFQVRTLTPHTKLVHLYAGNPDAITAFFTYLGPRGPHHPSGIDVPIEPGTEQASALRLITDLIRDEAIPFLDRFPDLDSVASVLRDRVATRERGPDHHDLEALAATCTLLGRDDEARSVLRTLIDEVDATEAKGDIVVSRGYDDEPGDHGWMTIPALSPWMAEIRKRARTMAAELDEDRHAVIERLAAGARANAKEAGLPTPDVP